MRDRDVPQGFFYGLVLGVLFFAFGRTWEAVGTGAVLGCVAGLLPTLRHSDSRLVESPLQVGALLGTILALLTGALSGSLQIGLTFFIVGLLSGALGQLTTARRV